MSFKEQIIKNLEANGFPKKKVSFDLEKMYELAEKNGQSLNNILDDLSNDGIANEKSTEKIIFSSIKVSTESEPQEDLFAKAQEAMNQMSPEELQKIQSMAENMSDEEKQKMMDQAKKMGLF